MHRALRDPAPPHSQERQAPSPRSGVAHKAQGRDHKAARPGHELPPDRPGSRHLTVACSPALPRRPAASSQAHALPAVQRNPPDLQGHPPHLSPHPVAPSTPEALSFQRVPARATGQHRAQLAPRISAYPEEPRKQRAYSHPLTTVGQPRSVQRSLCTRGYEYARHMLARPLAPLHPPPPTPPCSYLRYSQLISSQKKRRAFLFPVSTAAKQKREAPGTAYQQERALSPPPPPPHHTSSLPTPHRESSTQARLKAQRRQGVLSLDPTIETSDCPPRPRRDPARTPRYVVATICRGCAMCAAMWVEID
jgi:hypothetical protein